MPNGIEVNGPANIIILLDHYLATGTISRDIYVALKEQAERTCNYLRVLENPSGKKWSDIK